MMYRYKSCCWGCATLKTGTIIVGILCSLINAVIVTLLLVGKYQWYKYQQESSAVLITSLLIYISLVIFCVLMIIGAVMKKTNFIIPCLVVHAISIILNLIAHIAQSVDQFVSSDVAMGYAYLLSGILECVLNILLWFVPLSHVFELEEEKSQP